MRRLVVPHHFNLRELHLVLQAALGWTNSHLHEFEIGGLRFGDADIANGENGPDDKHRAYWKTHPNPDIRYFLERNANYARGDGLLSITPITLTNILGSSAIRNCERLSRALRVRRGTYEIEPRAPSNAP
jgi:hypothetical protein